MPDVEYNFVYPHSQAFDTDAVEVPNTVTVKILWNKASHLVKRIGEAQCTFYTVRLSFWFFRPLFTPSPALWAVY